MKLRESEASDDEDNANSCLQLTELSYNNLPTQRAKRVFLLCSLFPEEFHIQREDLERYAYGLGDRMRSMRSSIISEAINVLLDA
jgi:disease resistance protein RPS2